MLPIAALILTVGLSPAEDLPNGWHVRYEGALGRVDTHAPAAAFRLAPGEAPHPELRARGWTATYRGVVAIGDPATYRFSLEAEGGEATLLARDVVGREVGRAATRGGGTAETAWIALDRGPVVLEVRFERAARGEGRLRTLWEQQPSASGGFRSEPIPSSAVRVAAEDAAATADGLLAREGRAALERKGCTNCHSPGPAGAAAVGVRRAPSLERLDGRLRPEWVTRWIRDPAAIRPGTDMPHLLGDTPEGTARDLVQYLFREELTPPAPTPVHQGTLRHGRFLFHTLGCVACHGPFESAAAVFDDPTQPTDVPRDDVPVPYGDLRGKWHEGALVEFLLDPHAVRPDGTMPSFRLSREDAEALAGYLWERFEDGAAPAHPNEAPFERDAAAAERGRVAFGALGCSACHAQESAPAAPARAPLARLDAARGCLDPHASTGPRYDLTDTDRAALARGLASAGAAQGVPAPTDTALRTFTALACTRCHRLDGGEGVPDALQRYFVTLDDRVDLGDEGRLPPDLSGVGFKLRPEWLHRVVEQGARARPYMSARMPAFGEAAAALPEAFAAIDGVAAGADGGAPPATEALARAGAHLVGRDGMSCITCHSYRDWPPAGSPGPAITAFAERLRYEWWRAYIQAPSRYKPGTRMPAFSIGRRSTVENVLDGDIYRQGDAMWTLFLEGEEMAPPVGVRPASSLEIVVRDRPVVLRTFLEHAGSRGIAVGFPVGIHVGFDAEGCRLAEGWRGDFLDASGAWAGRGGQVANGQGPNAWRGPPGPPLLFGERPQRWPEEVGRAAGYRFRGYRLDEAGTPTFRYDVDEVRVEERIEPFRQPHERIARSFVLSGAGGRTAWLNAGEGDVRLTEAAGARVTPRPQEGGGTWFEIEVPADAADARFTVEVGL